MRALLRYVVVGTLGAAVLSVLAAPTAEAAQATHHVATTQLVTGPGSRHVESSEPVTELRRIGVGSPTYRIRPRVIASASVPGAPFVENVIPEGLSALVSWVPNPASDAVTGYTLTATATKGPAGCLAPPVLQAPATDSMALVTGLCAAVAYTVTMTATNATGAGPPSGASNPVVPLVAQPPSAPLITSVQPRTGGLVISWSPPSIPGGKALSGYTLSASASGTSTVTINPKASAVQATLSGLVDGTTYSLSLVATSAAGSSTAGTSTGTPSASAAPESPSSLEVVPNGKGALVATWAPPGDPGSSPVTGYTLSAQAETESGGVWSPTGSPTTQTAGASATKATITGLTATDFYAVSIVATSAAGNSPASTTANPVLPKITVKKTTIVLSATTMSALASDTAGVLYWPAPAPTQVTTLAKGDVLVGTTSAATPEGLLATVTAVSNDGSGDYTVATTSASLSDAFTNLSFGFAGDPLAQSGSSFQAQTAGVRTVRHQAGVGLGIGATLSLDLGAGPLSVSGSVNLRAEVNISAEVNTHFLIPTGVSLSASASVSASAELTATLTASHSWQVGEIDSPAPIDIPVGPVQVLIEPKIPVFLNVSGSITVGISASMTVGAGLSWSSENPGVLHTTNLTTGPHLSGAPLLGAAASASGTIGLALQPQLAIYDAAGPNIEADANLTATVNFNGSPWFELSPSVSLKAGVDIDVFGFHGSLDVTLGTFAFAAFTIDQPPNAGLSISPSDPTVVPGTPTAFTATRTDGKSYPVTWTLMDAARGDAITSAGVLTVVNPSGRYLTVVAEDTTGAVGKTTVTVGAAFDPVGNLSAQQDSNSLNATVGWSAPANTGGKPIADYTVTTSNGVPTQTTSGTGVSLSGLHPGITYVITVYPTNTAGVTGPASSTTLRVIPLCTDTFTGGSTSNPTAWSVAANWSGGYVPGPSDWVCTDGYSIVLPASAVSVQGLQQYGGTITIPKRSSLVVDNTLIEGGDLSGPGTLTVPAGSSAVLASQPGGNGAELSGGVDLVNDGSMELQGSGCVGMLFYGSSVLENAATLTLAGNPCPYNEDSSASEILNDVGATIVFDESSSATIQVALIDKGTVDVGGGTLSLSRLTLGARSHIIETLSSSTPTGAAGQIAVSAPVTLEGTLKLVLAKGFVPSAGERFTILSYSAESGMFANVEFPNGSTDYTLAYGISSATLTYG